MKLSTKLNKLAKLVAEAADRDPEFAAGLEELFSASQPTRQSGQCLPSRPKNRRPAAVLDPVLLAKESEDVLRENLSELSLDQLKDIVADYGMDPGKLVMKWKDPARVIDRIVEMSLERSQKGDAFRAE